MKKTFPKVDRNHTSVSRHFLSPGGVGWVRGVLVGGGGGDDDVAVGAGAGAGGYPSQCSVHSLCDSVNSNQNNIR